MSSLMLQKFSSGIAVGEKTDQWHYKMQYCIVKKCFYLISYLFDFALVTDVFLFLLVSESVVNYKCYIQMYTDGLHCLPEQTPNGVWTKQISSEIYIHFLGRLRLQQHEIFKRLSCNGTMADGIDKTRMRLEICSKDTLNTVDFAEVFFYWIRHIMRIKCTRVQQISFNLIQPVSQLRLVHTYEVDTEASEASMCIPFNMKLQAIHTYMPYIHWKEQDKL